MRIRTNVGAGVQQVITPVNPVTPTYTVGATGVQVIQNGNTGVTPSTLPVVDMGRQAINIFDGVKAIPSVRTNSGFNSERAYECLLNLLNMTPNTPEIMIFASRLKELGNSNQFSAADSRALDKVMSAIVSSALDELIDRDENKYALLMEAICGRAVNDVSINNVSKWIGSGSGSTNGVGRSLVHQAVNAFRSYMVDNGLTKFDNISKFKKHFNNFAGKRSEYKDVLISEAWSVFNGGR